MSFVRPTYQEIYDRIKSDITSRLTGNVPLMKYSLLNILAWVWAGACHLVYGSIQWLSKQIIPGPLNDTEFLLRHAFFWLGGGKIAAVANRSNFGFTGTPGTSVPSGTRFVSDSGVDYRTTITTVLGAGTTSIPAISSITGAISNIPVGAILGLSSPIAFVDNNVTCLSEITPGSDEETDEALLKRILFRVQNPPAGGSRTDYVAWALASSSAIKNAWCFPNYSGLGTVQVVVIQTGSDPVATGGQLAIVDNYIKVGPPVRAPVTALITVSTVVPKDVQFYIKLKPRDAALETKIHTALQVLFDNEASPKGNDTATKGVRYGTILLSHIRDAIASVPGVEDYFIDGIYVDTILVATADITLSGLDYHKLVTTQFLNL